MNQVRSDLAPELYRDLLGNNDSLPGIEYKKDTRGPLTVETVHIKTVEGETLAGRPRGEYVTVGTGKLWLDDTALFRDKVLRFRNLLRPYLGQGKGCVMIAGLGNRRITADAIGPIATEHLLVTRHLAREKPRIIEHLGLCETCSVTPGVLGETGIESADLLQGAVACVRPRMVVVIDALAAREVERLVTTVQLGTAGICPGSGIGNDRRELSEKTLGVPVLSVGVPTVVDGATLAADAVRRFAGVEQNADEVRKAWRSSGLNFFVTPKETDEICRVMGAFLAYGINLALNPHLSYEDMLSLAG